MTVFIARHGEGHHNTPQALEYLRAHGSDPVLTAKGVRQARALGRHIRAHWKPVDQGWPGYTGLAFDRLYSSPMKRCLQTAIALRGRMDVDIHIEPDLHECGGLDWHTPSGEVFTSPGVTTSDLGALAPRIRPHDRITDRGWWFSGEETAEQWEERGRRVVRWLDDLAETDLGSVLLVTHGGIGDVILRNLLGELDHAGRFFRMSNTGFTRVEIQPERGRRILHFHNSVRHLSGRLLTE
jgi:broad specificity phosphatase PhoE